MNKKERKYVSDILERTKGKSINELANERFQELYPDADRLAKEGVDMVLRFSMIEEGVQYVLHGRKINGGVE